MPHHPVLLAGKCLHETKSSPKHKAEGHRCFECWEIRGGKTPCVCGERSEASDQRQDEQPARLQMQPVVLTAEWQRRAARLWLPFQPCPEPEMTGQDQPVSGKSAAHPCSVGFPLALSFSFHGFLSTCSGTQGLRQFWNRRPVRSVG